MAKKDKIQDDGFVHLTAKPHYDEREPSNTESTLSYTKFNELVGIYQNEYLDAVVVSRKAKGTKRKAYTSDDIKQLYNKVVSVNRKSFELTPTTNSSEEKKCMALRLLLCDRDSVFYYYNESYLANYRNRNWLKQQKRLHNESALSKKERLLDEARKAMPAPLPMVSSERNTFYRDVAYLIDLCGQRWRQFLEKQDIDFENPNFKSAFRSTPDDDEGDDNYYFTIYNEKIRQLLKQGYVDNHLDTPIFSNAYCFYILYCLEKYYFKKEIDVDNQENVMFVSSAQEEWFHAFVKALIQYDGLVSTANIEANAEINYHRFENQNLFSTALDCAQSTTEENATVKIIVSLYNRFRLIKVPNT